MKYRVTQTGFIDRIVKPGDVVEIEGDPPIAGLEPIEDDPAEEPVKSSGRKQRQSPDA